MEILDLYDDNFNRLDETLVRGNVIPQDKNIMLSVVFIKNSKGDYLIQKTSKEKGSKYSTTGGHVIHNEDGITTIIRELEEELGLNKEDKDLKHIVTFKYPTKNCIFNVYLLEEDIDVKSLQLQKEEVDTVDYLSINNIEKIIMDGNFLESHAYIFNNYIKK